MLIQHNSSPIRTQLAQQSSSQLQPWKETAPPLRNERMCHSSDQGRMTSSGALHSGPGFSMDQPDCKTRHLCCCRAMPKWRSNAFGSRSTLRQAAAALTGKTPPHRPGPMAGLGLTSPLPDCSAVLSLTQESSVSAAPINTKTTIEIIAWGATFLPRGMAA